MSIESTVLTSIRVVTGKKLKPNDVISDHLDSLDKVELLMEISDHLSVEIEEDELNACTKIRDLVTKITSKKK